MIKGGHF